MGNVIANNQWGVYLKSSINCQVVENVVRGNGNGVVSSGKGNIILKNRIIHSETGLYCGSESDTITSNFIGNSDGSKAAANLTYGIEIIGKNNVVGGTNPGESNVISGNREGGIKITGNSSGNKIVCNKIGTDLSGLKALGNLGNGILIEDQSCKNIIYQNTISANSESGIRIADKESKGNEIYGNTIGLNSNANAVMSNEGDGIAANGDSTIIRENIVSGNSDMGIITNGENVQLSGNKIGTNGDGKKVLKNSGTGVLISGRKGQIRDNIISGNGYEGVIVAGENNTVFNNCIGVDITGNVALGNAKNGILVYGNNNHIHTNIVSGNKECGILLKSGYASCQKNILSHNNIGVGLDGETPLGNQTGIFLDRVELNEMHKNLVRSNHSTGIKFNDAYNNYLNANRIVDNTGPGVHIYRSNSCLVTLNEVSRNCKGIYVEGSLGTKLSGNYGKDNECATGIHLNASSGTLTGNTITGDAADAIKCQNGSNPLIAGNNIYNNAGMGLNNLDASIQIQAPNNWWGDASGPGGIANGMGEEVSGHVDFSDWLIKPVSLVAATGADTMYIVPGETDSMLCSFKNWSVPDDVVDVTLEDELGWLENATSFSLELPDEQGASVWLKISVPASVEEGTENKIHLSANAQSDPVPVASDSSVVITYIPSLAGLSVQPDSVSILQGDSLWFFSGAVDQVGKSYTADIVWEATSGTIDSTGFFKADSLEEVVFITATHTETGQSDTVAIQVATDSLVTSTLSVSPDSITLTPGANASFFATAYDQYGMKTFSQLVWDAGGGIIDNYGNYLAGVETGSFVVTATDTASGIWDQAVVEIIDVPVQTFSLTVTVDPPEAQAAGCLVSQNGEGTYTRGDTVTLTAIPSEGWEFESWSGSITATGNPLKLAIDSDKEITGVFKVVEQVNQAPVADAGSDQTVSEGETVTLDGTGSFDPDDDPLTYHWTAPEGITLSDETAAEPTFTAPEVSENTDYTFALIVNDGTEDSQPDEVIVTVQQVNKMPIANAGSDQTVSEGETVTLDGTGSFDPDDDPLTYHWTAPEGITLSDETAAEPTFTAPEVSENTDYTFALIVNDGTEDSQPDEVIVTVQQVNKTPIANAGSDQTVNEGETVTLDGTGSYDPDDDPLTYHWTAPEGITLSDETAAEPTFTAPEVSKDTDYTFALIVNDGTEDSQPDEVIVTVQQVNKTPIANAGSDQTVNEGETVTLDGTGSYDPDDDPLTYHWTAPEGITLSDETAAEPTFTAPEVTVDTTFVFSLVVNDGFAFSDPGIVNVLVYNLTSGNRILSEGGSFRVYPNPTKGVLTVEPEDASCSVSEISIYTVLGEMIFCKEYSAAASIRIDLSGHTAGIYLLKIKSGSNQAGETIFLVTKSF